MAAGDLHSGPPVDGGGGLPCVTVVAAGRGVNRGPAT